MKLQIAIRYALVFYCLAFASEAFSQEEAPEPPNVIFIICDDLNDAIHGMGGHPQAITPNIDHLSRLGVRFINAQCNAPLCGPSRASLWSGLYPHTTGYFGYNQQKNHWRKNEVLKNTITLFEHLGNNGYQVYATGKIHHNGHEDYSIFKNKDGSDGFRVRASFGPYPWDGDPATASMNVRGVMHPDMPDEFMEFRWGDGFGAVRDISDAYEGKGSWLYDHRGQEFLIDSAGKRDMMPDERCTRYALSVLQEKHQKPFFLAVGYNRPHTPLYVPEKYFNMYPLDSLILPPYLADDISDCSEVAKTGDDIHGVSTGRYKFNKINNAGGEYLWRRWVQAYLASVTFVDDQVGQVLRVLEKSEYAENTVIILTGDHGYHMGEKDLLFKNTTWEESTRIPLVIAGPGIVRNMECGYPVSLIDLYPTVVDYCGLPASPNEIGNGKELDGFSLATLLKNPVTGPWDGPGVAITAVCSQQELDEDQRGPVSQQHYSVRSARYRYILYRNGEEELYDHRYDPYEWYNLSSDSSYFQIMAGLKKDLYRIINP